MQGFQSQPVGFLAVAANSELQDWPRAPCTGGKESLATGLPGKASLLLVVSHLRIFCQIHNHEDSLWFLPRCFIAIFLAFTHMIHFLIFCKVSIHLDAFACGYPTFSAKFVEKTLFPLNGFGILVENFRSYMQGLISELSNPFHWSVCHLCQYHIVLINTVSFEIRNCESFNLVLLLKNVLAVLGP